MTASSQSPANWHMSPIPNASPPADNVPSARLNPLLKVAPAAPILIQSHKKENK